MRFRPPLIKYPCEYCNGILQDYTSLLFAPEEGSILPPVGDAAMFNRLGKLFRPVRSRKWKPSATRSLRLEPLENRQLFNSHPVGYLAMERSGNRAESYRGHFGEYARHHHLPSPRPG